MKKISILIICLHLANLSLGQVKTEVYILGTLHSNHLVSDFEYGFTDIENIAQIIKPDLYCIELTAEAFKTKLEGYFPPENTVIIDYAKKTHTGVVPVDWRYDLNKREEHKKRTNKISSKIHKANKKIQKTAINYLKKNGWKNYFGFAQNNKDFHQLIKNYHNTIIDLLGEGADGYWLTRNENIVKNILEAKEKHKARRILVTLGLHHKYIIEELLAKEKDIVIKRLPNYTSHAREVNLDIIGRWKKNLWNLKLLLEEKNVSRLFKYKIKKSKRIEELNEIIEAKGAPNKFIRHLFE